MSTSYVKEIATGKILTSTDGQDENNQVHIDAINNFVTSRGWNPADYEVGFKSKAEVEALIASAVTPLEQWTQDMANSDSTMIPRWLEDHITSDHAGVTGNAQLQAKYDAKVALRNSKPV